MRSRIRRYEGEALNVTYDIPRCIHVAECVRRLPAVFDPERRPWIAPDRAGAEELAAAVVACPTGALHFERREGSAERPPAENTLRVEPDGPLHAHGEIEVAEGAGTALRDTRAAFCRCGDSANRPLCDGAHHQAAFRDAGSVSGGPPAAAERRSGPVRFIPVPNGPLLFAGPLAVEDAGGRRRHLEKGALCRCGATGSRPFCDGSHKRVGFTAD